jgi:hypothetical protein
MYKNFKKEETKLKLFTNNYIINENYRDSGNC